MSLTLVHRNEQLTVCNGELAMACSFAAKYNFCKNYGNGNIIKILFMYYVFMYTFAMVPISKRSDLLNVYKT